VRTTAQLRRKILARSTRVGIVGQGYVGLSLACAAAEAGFPVVGIDIDDERVADLKDGRLTVAGVSESDFRSGLATGLMSFTTDPGALSDCEVIAICVATPVRDRTPDLSHVERACRDVVDRLQPGRIVILESSTYPGCTEGPVREILESGGLRAGRDFLLAYSPERIDPGNEEYTFRSIPRVVGALTPEGVGIAALFYGQVVDKVVTVGSCRAAELAKLLENTFRHVNIALVNELAMICNEMGIDTWEVLDAAGTKPFGFMPFHPGPGVGGNCIPVDPAYLAWQVRKDAGYRFRTLEQAQEINDRMPAYTATRIADALNDAGKAVKGSRVLVLGVAYKADVGDSRESPAVEVIAHLARRGAEVAFCDPHVGWVLVDGRPMEGVDLSQRVVERADCVAMLTPHSVFDLDWLADRARLIFDATNAYGPVRRENVVTL
jgi:UDP-N-acetyl-D-glucosamine dehydrogenase